jgi:hypothetical protein
MVSPIAITICIVVHLTIDENNIHRILMQRIEHLYQSKKLLDDFNIEKA